LQSFDLYVSQTGKIGNPYARLQNENGTIDRRKL